MGPGLRFLSPMRALLATSAPLLAAVGLFGAARSAPDATERAFVHGLLPLIAPWLARPSEAWAAAGLGGSCAEVLLVLAACAASWRTVKLARSGPGALARTARFALGLSGWLALGLLLTFGLGHARRPLHVLLGVSLAPADSGEVAALARELAARAAALRAGLPEDAHGVVARPLGAARSAERAFERASSAVPALRGPGARVVEPRLSGLLVAARVSGVFSPFTREAHVVADLPAIAYGATALHELAHARGFAREDEANALAYFVGVESGEGYLEYSARALALVHALRVLAAVDPAEYDGCVAALAPGLLRDLAQQRAYWSRPRSLLARGFGGLATATNDAYLRSMGARDGVQSYGRMLDLVLAWRRAEPAGAR